MKRIYFAPLRTLLFILFSIIYTFSFSQDFMMQGWYWDYPKEACIDNPASQAWAENLQSKAATLGNAGFTFVWLPPASRASFGACSNGYDPQDLYDLGEFGQGPTGLGTRDEVDALIAALSANGVNAVADVIYNHRDGGGWEDNPGVQDYINNYHTIAECNGSVTPYPLNGKVRFVLPLGGSSGNNAGEYYIKFASASGNSGLNGRPYKLYAETNTVGFQDLDAETESEPNGGGDCGETFNDLNLGVDLVATQEIGSCNTDEFRITLSNSDFNNSGDFLYLYLSQENGDGTGIDIRPYGIFKPNANGNGGTDLIGQLKTQTRTNFNNLPSGQGGMNYLNFKPNGINTTCLTGDFDFPFFFFDIEDDQASTASVYADFSEWLWDDVGYRGFRMDAVKHFEPALLSQILNHLSTQGIFPGMLVGELFDSDPNKLKDWVNSVNTPAGMNLRVFDFSMREALKNACDAFGYDVRNVYNSGIVNAVGASPFQSVTFVNNHDFRKEGEPVQNDPMLAYAYIMTNNQIGLPCVFYPDYFGDTIPFAPTVNLQSQIDELIAVHKDYIFGATNIEYLNRFSTPYTGVYNSGFPNTTLLYQLSGGTSGKEVIVAINFAGENLSLDHTIETGSLPANETFYAVAGSTITSSFTVSSGSSISIQVPARSYAVWVNDMPVGLPVELSAFNVYPNERTVKLQWTSANEVNFSHFEIERSTDGRNFAKIGLVSAANQSLYQFIDQNPVFNQTMYYRLKLVDQDGSFAYSDLRTTRLTNGITEIKVLPNPTKSSSSLWLESQHAGEALIEILDINGQLIASQQVFIQDGNNTFALLTSDLPQGVYFVRLQLGNSTQLVKLAKL